MRAYSAARASSRLATASSSTFGGAGAGRITPPVGPGVRRRPPARGLIRPRRTGPRPAGPGGRRSSPRIVELPGVKVLSIVGNRPQFVKSAPLSLALRAWGIRETVLHTGQHYDRELSQVFFEELDLAEPDYRLDLHSSDPRAMRPGIASALELERPDWALVFGDTNSTLAGAQAALEKAVPVAHVEAGLRSGDLSMPEERNRIEVDTVAALLLCPDERSREILRGEAVGGEAVVVGDVMIDALRL